MSVASSFGDSPNGDGKQRLDLADCPLYSTLSLTQQFHVVQVSNSWDKMHPVDQYNMVLNLSMQVLAGQNAAADIMKQQFKGLGIPGLEELG